MASSVYGYSYRYSSISGRQLIDCLLVFRIMKTGVQRKIKIFIIYDGQIMLSLYELQKYRNKSVIEIPSMN